MPNRKTDSNNRNLFSTDYIGRSWNWAEGTYEQREELRLEHENYIRGLFWFLTTDERLPAALREAVARWGLARDEFGANGHWPHQLYVREARRMIGEYVVTEHDCTAARVADDPVVLASYAMDSHVVSMFAENGKVRLEGAYLKSVKPYPVSYRALLPKRDKVSNLLVPVCLSSSHAAYGSIRMEPVFMMLGQAAATAAVLALESGTPLHTLPYEALRARLEADGQVLGLRAKTAPAAKAKVKEASATAKPAVAKPTGTKPVTPKPADDPKLAAALVKLERVGVIDEKIYWYINARLGQQCDGARVGALLIAAAQRHQPVADFDAALAVLLKKRVFTKAAYWQANAVAGRTCSGNQVASLLSRLAQTTP